MGKNIVYFDLETQRSFSAVGGSKNKAKMGISVGVAYSTLTEKYHIFDESNIDDLGNMLLAADLVVGYNHIDFDYPVLQGYVLNLKGNDPCSGSGEVFNLVLWLLHQEVHILD